MVMDVTSGEGCDKWRYMSQLMGDVTSGDGCDKW